MSSDSPAVLSFLHTLLRVIFPYFFIKYEKFDKTLSTVLYLKEGREEGRKEGRKAGVMM